MPRPRYSLPWPGSRTNELQGARSSIAAAWPTACDPIAAPGQRAAMYWRSPQVMKVSSAPDEPDSALHFQGVTGASAGVRCILCVFPRTIRIDRNRGYDA